MSNEELNKALYDKMEAELKRYGEWLVSQPPDEILRNAYEYGVRQDIVLYLQDNDLDDEQAQALLDMESPLYNTFNHFEKLNTGHMHFIRMSLEVLANEQIHLKRELRETPVYPYPSGYAKENGEQEVYRASKEANAACRTAIDDIISRRFRGFGLDDPSAAVKEATDQFGFERVLFVLANTVRWNDQDERFSADNRQWSLTIPVFDHEDERERGRSDYVLRSHPVKADAFITAARHEYLLTQPLTQEEITSEAQRILDALKAEREPNSPSGTHYMAEISPDFLRRANEKNRDTLLRLLPFKSICFSPLEDRKGMYALISKDEDRASKTALKKASTRRKKRPER